MKRLKKLDAELLKYKQQMTKMRAGPAKNQVQQRALRVLKQKKIYEKQRESLYNQQFNIDQTKFAQQNLKDTATMVTAMKSANKELKKSYAEVKIDDIEDLQDDMGDMLELNDEINEVMGRSYGVPEEVDENDLNEELAALEDQIDVEAEAEVDSQQVPAYLVNAATASKSAAMTNKDEKKVSAEIALDANGMPNVPSRKLEI